MDWKTHRRFFSPCSVGEFKFATDALLPWTTILLLLNDWQLCFHSAHSVPNSRIQGLPQTTILTIPEWEQVIKNAPKESFQVFSFQTLTHSLTHPLRAEWHIRPHSKMVPKETKTKQKTRPRSQAMKDYMNTQLYASWDRKSVV